MGAIKRMDQIIDILTIYQRTRSINATFKAAKCSRNTVRTYLRLANARAPDLSVVLKLPPDELRTVFYPKTAEEPPDWQRYFEGRIDHWVKELRKVGVTLKLFWEEYKVLQVSRYNETQSYRSCMGVLSLVKKYGPDRLEAASARLRPAGRGRGAFPIRPQPLNDRVYHS